MPKIQQLNIESWLILNWYSLFDVQSFRPTFGKAGVPQGIMNRPSRQQRTNCSKHFTTKRQLRQKL